MSSQTWRASLAATCVLALAACHGTTRAVERPSVAPSAAADARCPATFPNPGWSGGEALPGPIVPPGATRLVDCGYDYAKSVGGVKTALTHPLVGETVRGVRAVNGYVLSLAHEPPASTDCRTDAVTPRGPGDGAQNTVILSYPNGRSLTLDLSDRCPAIAAPDGRTLALDRTTAEILGSLAPEGGPPPDVPSKPAINTVGLTVDQARRAGAKVTVDAESLDPAVPLGTILVQSPTAGEGTTARRSVGVIVADRSEPICTTRTLAASFARGGAGAGTAFASLTIIDIGRRPCSLSGPLHVSALNKYGQVVASNTVAVHGSSGVPFVLGADGSATGASTSANLVATTFLSSTDDAANCSGRVSIPIRWLVSIGADPHGRTPITATDQPSRPRGTGGPPIIVCRGTVTEGPATLPGNIKLQ